MTHNLEKRLFHHWYRGDTIRETIISVRRAMGVTLDFERVRIVYVDLSEQFSGMAGDVMARNVRVAA